MLLGTLPLAPTRPEGGQVVKLRQCINDPEGESRDVRTADNGCVVRVCVALGLEQRTVEGKQLVLLAHLEQRRHGKRRGRYNNQALARRAP